MLCIHVVYSCCAAFMLCIHVVYAWRIHVVYAAFTRESTAFTWDSDASILRMGQLQATLMRSSIHVVYAAFTRDSHACHAHAFIRICACACVCVCVCVCVCLCLPLMQSYTLHVILMPSYLCVTHSQSFRCIHMS